MTTQLMTVEEMVSDLLYAGDGPVTDYVIISRGVDLVKQPNTTGEDVANAMYEALNVLKAEGGYIPSNEFTRARAL